MFGPVQVLMLIIDSGSAVNKIDEEVWNLIKAEGDELNKVSFPIKTAAQHTLAFFKNKWAYSCS